MVAVVVPNWNGKDHIGESLKSLMGQTQKIEIIVIDNGSTDGSVEYLKQKFPKVKLIELKGNTGFAGGVNAGIKAAMKLGAEFVALFNNDAMADKDWVKNLLKTSKLSPKTGIVTCKFLHIGKGVPNYPYSLLLGIILWTFFVEATSQSLKSIVGNGSLIRKINIPRYMIPTAAILSALINMGLNLIVLFGFVAFSNDPAVSLGTVLIFPLLLIELLLVTVATSLFLSAVFVRFRDLDHIWEVVRQALFYTVPIIYPLTLIHSEPVRKIIMLDPLAQIIQEARHVITYSGTPTIGAVFHGGPAMYIPFALAFLALVIGVAVFKKESKFFAENV